MPQKRESLHKTWNVAARDDEGHGMDLRLAVEQTGQRGYAAYAYWDRKPEDLGDENQMIVASTDFAPTGAEAFRALRNKLESDRGVMLESDDPPDWLLSREWEQTPPRAPEEDEHSDETRQ